MKKALLILSILCLAAFESRSGNDGPHIPIQILQSSQEEGLTQRGGDAIPIYACYENILSSVCMSFSQNIGFLDIMITNLSTSAHVDYEVDSSLGSAILPIPGNEGIYNILIITAGGIQYGGEFEII